MESSNVENGSGAKPAADLPIDINEQASVAHWVAALECSEFDLRMAVAKVGSAVEDVGNQLGRVM